VVQTIGGREERFCCQGCARVYQLAHESGTLEQIVARSHAVRPAQKDVAEPGSITRFAVQGMHCASCVKIIVRTLRRQPGVLESEVDLASGQGWMRYDPAQVDPAAVLHRLDEFGYQARPLAGDGQQRAPGA